MHCQPLTGTRAASKKIVEGQDIYLLNISGEKR